MLDKPIDRDQLLDIMIPLMYDFKGYVLGDKRIRDRELARIRIQFANALSRLVNTSNAVLKEMELEEIKQELEELKNELESNKERYQ